MMSDMGYVPETVALSHIFPHLKIEVVPQGPVFPRLEIKTTASAEERQLVYRALGAVMWLAAKERGEDVPERPL